MVERSGRRFNLFPARRDFCPKWIEEQLSADALRAACERIEEDLLVNAPEDRAPRVWISGFGGGMQLKASAWLRQDADRREAQRELLLRIRARLEEHASSDDGRRTMTGHQPSEA